MSLTDSNDPFDKLLRSRIPGQGQTTSNLTPSPLPMNLFTNTKNSSQLDNRYKDLQAISDRTTEQRNGTEEKIARQIQKQQQDAMMRKIKALMAVPHYPGGGGGIGGGGTGGLGGLNPSLPKPKGNGYNLPYLTPPVVPGYTDSQFGAIAGTNQYIHPDTHITQAKPKPWYQKLWPPWGPLQ